MLSEEWEEVKRLERVGAPRELRPEERQRQQEMAARAIPVTLATLPGSEESARTQDG